jgi:hypothetical protein
MHSNCNYCPAVLLQDNKTSRTPQDTFYLNFRYCIFVLNRNYYADGYKGIL